MGPRQRIKQRSLIDIWRTRHSLRGSNSNSLETHSQNTGLKMAPSSISARSQSPLNAPRGPAARRKAGARADRDGDLKMDVGVKGRGRIGKPLPAAGSSDLTSRISRSQGRAGILSGTARGAILRQAASGGVSAREERSSVSRGGLVELKVTGWEKSKASSDADGGVSSLIKWLEKKASHRLGSRTRDVKVKKVCSANLSPISAILYTCSPQHPVRLRLQPISERRPRFEPLAGVS